MRNVIGLIAHNMMQLKWPMAIQATLTATLLLQTGGFVGCLDYLDLTSSRKDGLLSRQTMVGAERFELYLYLLKQHSNLS